MTTGEFNLINKYFLSSFKRKEVLLGIGDDCAIASVPEDKLLAITTDTLVDGVHFPSNTSPDDIACKSVAVNLSDLAAMGAEPAWLTLALSLPQVDESWIKCFSDSFRKTAEKYHVQLIGGDTTQGPLSMTVQAMGFVEPDNIMRRDGARPGDVIYVSGTLGDAAAGLKILQTGQAVDANRAWLVNRLNRPQARVELGLKASAYCKCAIDISDGLAADLGHVLEASNCGATVNIDSIPLSHQLLEYSINRNEVDWEMVLSAGDDYELCLLVNPEHENELMQTASNISLPLTRIGVIEENTALNIVDNTGAKYLLERGGYEHFTK